MQTTPTAIPEVVHLRPVRHEDARGFFSETFRAAWFPGLEFVQDNHSYSAAPGTLRGLHFQTHPHAQAKLVRVARGRVLDVAVDIRVGSPTFGEHVAVELSEDTGDQLLVPVGFAHGFLTLEPDTEVLYKVSAYHSAEHDTGIRWDDPDLAIPWGVTGPLVSDKDAALPSLADLPTHFEYPA
jgi:dTDP-4-dehydrorhamnose 3,5-epimerase